MLFHGLMHDRSSSTAFSWRETLRRNRAWLLVGLAVLVVLVVRVRLWEMPLERDESEYTYAAYSLIMAVFGRSRSGIRSGLALVNAAASVPGVTGF